MHDLKIIILLLLILISYPLLFQQLIININNFLNPFHLYIL